MTRVTPCEGLLCVCYALFAIVYLTGQGVVSFLGSIEVNLRVIEHKSKGHVIVQLLRIQRGLTVESYD